jgi:hypothetical protein
LRIQRLGLYKKACLECAIKNRPDKRSWGLLGLKIAHPVTLGESYGTNVPPVTGKFPKIERIREWVEYYNHPRYHEAIDNVTPADKYYGRDLVILKKREKVRQKTMKIKRELNRLAMIEALPNGVSSIIMRDGIRSLGNQHASPKPPDDKQAAELGHRLPDFDDALNQVDNLVFFYFDRCDFRRLPPWRAS